jgi:RHS repeat-associated protein
MPYPSSHISSTKAQISGQGALFSSTHRFTFNGKESDSEVKGEGNQQDYGMRIYDNRLGRFLSVDPLFSGFPWWTPFQFAGNSPIDGIDLDGLEYLDSDEAVIEFKFGLLRLKLENFMPTNRAAWNRHNISDNWQVDKIGLDQTVATVQFRLEDTKPEDIPAEHLPSFSQGQTESGVQSKAVNRAGENVHQRGKSVNVPPNKNDRRLKCAAAIEFVNMAGKLYVGIAAWYDESKIEEHKKVAKLVTQDMSDALEMGIIPPEYRNAEDLINIMNVVLQGVNNTNDKRIYEIGMEIYTRCSNPPTQPYVPGNAPPDASFVNLLIIDNTEIEPKK